jgi:selenocysteine lyase/cysteine desulfurase
MQYESPILYANNATTSWPKPDTVAEAMLRGLGCANSSRRGGGLDVADADALLAHARKTCARFLGVADEDNLMFVPSATYGLNMIISGFLKPGDAVIVARAEHNSVLRPIHALEQIGLDIAWAPMAPGGFVDLAELDHLLRVGVDEGRPFKAVICRHGSNASGALQPLEDVVLLAHQYDAVCISDGAQVAGHVPLQLDRLGVDAWICSGHKGLLGPKGIGLMYLAPQFDLDLTIWGGTGSGDADDLCADHVRPDCYEPGTEPLPAILGLEAGVLWLADNEQAVEHVRTLNSKLREGLRIIEKVRVLGPDTNQPQLPLVPIVIEGIPATVLGATLQQRYGIITRSGLHCSPDAAKVLGVYPEGSVRFSLGPFSTQEDVDMIITAVSEIAQSVQ